MDKPGVELTHSPGGEVGSALPPELRANFRREVALRSLELLYERIEIVVTLVLDGIVLVVTLYVRAGLVWVVRHGVPEEAVSLPVKILEILLDFGLIGTAFVLVTFDLVKRVKKAIRNTSGRD